MLVASVGDRLIIRGHRVGEPERDAEIIEVRGPDGSPPYLVRWSGTVTSRWSSRVPMHSSDTSNDRKREEAPMQTISRLHRSGVGVAPDRTIADVAKLMNSSGIGSIAVLDGDRLVGFVTDRDLVRRGLARDLPVDARVDSVMTSPVLTIAADAPLHDAVETLRPNMPFDASPSSMANASSA